MSQVPSRFSKVYDLFKTRALNSSIAQSGDKKALLYIMCDGRIYIDIEFDVSSTINGGDVLIDLSGIKEMAAMKANNAPMLLVGRNKSTTEELQYLCSFKSSTTQIIFSDTVTAGTLLTTSRFFMSGLIFNNDVRSISINLVDA